MSSSLRVSSPKTREGCYCSIACSYIINIANIKKFHIISHPDLDILKPITQAIAKIKTISIAIHLCAQGLLAFSSAPFRCSTPLSTCPIVSSMLKSMRSISDPCSITSSFSCLYIADSWFIDFTSSVNCLFLCSYSLIYALHTSIS